MNLLGVLDAAYAPHTQHALPPIDDAARQRLVDYVGLITRWNAVYNLTAVRDPADMMVQHILDSLAVVPPMLSNLDALPKLTASTSRVLDVGSGAGLPGVVIAVACPHITVVCVDTVAKKASFIRQVAAQLGLPNLHSHHARVEALGAGAFELVTSRAFASLSDFTRLTRRHLAPNGVWMAMKGKVPHIGSLEWAELPADVDVFHVEQIRVPSLDAERCLVWMRPAQALASMAALP